MFRLFRFSKGLENLFLRVSIGQLLNVNIVKKVSFVKSDFLTIFLLYFSEETDNGEAAKLESRLRSLSSGLIGLRHCLHEKGENMLPPTFVASSNYLQGK